MHGDAREDGSDDCRNAPKNAYGHDDVEWNAHLSHGKDPAVLQKNGYFDEHKTSVVTNDTPEQVLRDVSPEVYT
jgi:uncharacterized protein YpuA (DUF1002 family)